MAFDEDCSPAHLQDVQASWIALTHFATNLLKLNKTVKAGVGVKRLRAGWVPNRLFKLLAS